jgi:hypothetical protein
MQPDELAIPILPSRSVNDTVAFYRRLGFEGGAHAADSGYAILRRGDVELHFFTHRALKPAESSAGCYIRVSDVEGVHRAFSSSGLSGAGGAFASSPSSILTGTSFASVRSSRTRARRARAADPGRRPRKAQHPGAAPRRETQRPSNA